MLTNAIAITLTAAQWEEIENAATGYRDQGPEGEGWQSDELSEASAALRKQLNEAMNSSADTTRALRDCVKDIRQSG